jgi:hypothetical protein
MKCPKCDTDTSKGIYSHEKGCWICPCGSQNNVFEMVVLWQSRAEKAEAKLKEIADYVNNNAHMGQVFKEAIRKIIKGG